MIVFVVLAYYSDGSSMGEDTVLAVFSNMAKAERFVELVKKTYPTKDLAIAERIVE